MNVLLVEDEARVADFVQRGLKAEGWSVSVAPTGESALLMIADACFDVIVLDLMLPGISGQDVCRRLRAKKNRTPILMLSALADAEDRVAGVDELGHGENGPAAFALVDRPHPDSRLSVFVDPGASWSVADGE